MCLRLNLRGVNNTLNYPKDTQLNTPSLPMNLRYCSSWLGDRPAQPCNFFYPIDFVVKHPVAPEISPVPTLGWVRTAANFLALLKDQHPWFWTFIFEQRYRSDRTLFGRNLLSHSSQKRA